jgi:hypothetical protein
MAFDPVLKGRACSERHAFELPERHGKRAPVAKANHLAGSFASFRARNPKPPAQADGPGGAGDLDHETFHVRNPAKAGQTRHGRNRIDQSFHNAPREMPALSPKRRALCTTSWTEGFKWR